MNSQTLENKELLDNKFYKRNRYYRKKKNKMNKQQFTDLEITILKQIAQKQFHKENKFINKFLYDLRIRWMRKRKK
jgi:hypothetical protein